MSSHSCEHLASISRDRAPPGSAKKRRVDQPAPFISIVAGRDAGSSGERSSRKRKEADEGVGEVQMLRDVHTALNVRGNSNQSFRELERAAWAVTSSKHCECTEQHRILSVRHTSAKHTRQKSHAHAKRGKHPHLRTNPHSHKNSCLHTQTFNDTDGNAGNNEQIFVQGSYEYHHYGQVKKTDRAGKSKLKKESHVCIYMYTYIYIYIHIHVYR